MYPMDRSVIDANALQPAQLLNANNEDDVQSTEVEDTVAAPVHLRMSSDEKGQVNEGEVTAQTTYKKLFHLVDI